MSLKTQLVKILAEAILHVPYQRKIFLSLQLLNKNGLFMQKC